MPTYQPSEILLDKYRIEALLGQGAFGEVYRVTHLGLNVTRALKVLRRDAPGIGSSEFNDGQMRFQLEAQLGAQLNSPTPHPNLLQVHNFEKNGDLLALEMEYAPGGSLAERLSKAKEAGKVILVEEALQIALDVANGLAVLHTRDIVHRDIKPGNILFDGQGHGKLVDLGLAQIPSGPSMRSQLSSPSPHPGTPGYMSPEQENAGGLLKPTSDVYALGLLLFEMLTGRSYALLRPGTRANSLQPDILAVVDALLARMLAADAKERPWDGKECAELLQSTLGKLPPSPLGTKNKTAVPAQSADPLPLPKKPRSGGLLMAALLVFGLLLAAGTIFLVWQNNKAAAIPTQTALALTETVVPASATPQSMLTATTAPINIPATITLTATPTIPLGIGSTLTREKDGMVMLYVPEGPFTMGSDKGWYADEKPAHIVTLDAFWMDKTVVTNAMYALCVQAGVCQPPSNSSSATRSSYYGDASYANYPVIYVNWNQAKSYCEWAGAALPSEAQWEKAARGTDGRTYPWGEGIDQSRANYGGTDTTAVGSYESGKSPYGMLDMAANVEQWVADWYDPNYYKSSPASNPTGPASGDYRVMRGGSRDLNDNLVLSAARNGDTPSVTYDYNGFRCARSQ